MAIRRRAARVEMKKALELIETNEDRNDMLNSLQIKETDPQSLEFVTRFKQAMQDKFE